MTVSKFLMVGVLALSASAFAQNSDKVVTFTCTGMLQQSFTGTVTGKVVETTDSATSNIEMYTVNSGEMSFDIHPAANATSGATGFVASNVKLGAISGTVMVTGLGSDASFDLPAGEKLSNGMTLTAGTLIIKDDTGGLYPIIAELDLTAGDFWEAVYLNCTWDQDHMGNSAY